MFKKRLVAGILSAAVSIMQLLPAFSTTVFAADDTVHFTMSSAKGEPGDSVSVDINISSDPDIISTAFYLGYDTNALTCTAVNDHKVFGTGVGIESPFIPPADISKSGFKLSWVGFENLPRKGNLLTIEFTVNDDAYNGEYEITMIPSEGDTFSYAGGQFTEYETDFVNGKITVTGSTVKEKYDGEIPSVPEITNITATTFDIALEDGVEYTYSDTPISDFKQAEWHTEKTASGLKGNTKYYVYVRVAETDEVQASDPSDAKEITTGKYNISDVIESVSIGTNGTADTVLTPVITYKKGYSGNDAGDITYLWSAKDWIRDEDVTMAETYTVTADDVQNERILNVTIAAKNCDGFIKSNSVTAGKSDYIGTVNTPDIDVTSDGFVIAPMDGYECIISETSAIPEDAAWADLGSGLTVDGKPANSTWYVFVRVKATTTVNASEPVSKEVRVPNNDSGLDSVSVSDSEVSIDISEGTTEYSAVVPYGNPVPTVSAVPNDKNANVTVKQAESFEEGKNTAVIVVTAENGVDSTTYTITFTEQERTEPPVIVTDDSVKLSRKGIVEITGSGTVYYTTDGSRPTASSKVYANGIDVASLNIPKTTNSLTVKAAAIEDGKALSEVVSKTFTLTDTDASLNELKINGESINGFSADITEYTYTISYAEWISNKNKTYEISASALKPESDVSISENNFILESINPDLPASRAVHITVTAESGDTAVYTVTFIIEACPHADIDTKVIFEPNCTEPGQQESVCRLCGKNWGIEYTPAIGHTWSEEWTIDQDVSCTEDGYRSHHCTVCGAQNDVEIIPAAGHSWSEWVKYSENEYVRACLTCGEAEAEAVEDTSHDHVFNGNIVEITPATCSSEGLRNVYCSVPDCTEFLTETIAKTAHTAGEPEVISPDCTTSGSSETKCSVCGKLLGKTDIPPLGHSFVNYTDTATCTEMGTRTSECENGCGTVYSAPSYPKGHTYSGYKCDENGHWQVCDVCGSTTGISAHISDNGTVTTPATAASDGVRTYYCTVCGYTLRTETIPAIGVDPVPAPPTPTPPVRPNQSPTDVTTVQPQMTEPSIFGNDQISGWEAIEAAAAAADGGVISIDMNNTYEIPAEILSIIQGRNITLELNMDNGFVWDINGINVTNPKEINLRASTSSQKIPADIVNALESEKDAVQLRLYYSGDLGFDGMLTVPLPKQYNGYYAKLYYYNLETKQLEQTSLSCLVKDQKAVFAFSHASYYVIAFSSEPIYEDVSSGAAAVDLAPPAIDAGMPAVGGLQIVFDIPKISKYSNKKRRYRILRKRCIDDLVFDY